METSRSLSHFNFLVFVVILFVQNVNGMFDYNLVECRNQRCSFEKDIDCVIQRLEYPCLPGKTKDTFIKDIWPGKPRNLTARPIELEDEWKAEFTWQPPYDSSIHSLEGFQIIVNFNDDLGIGYPRCFFANITSSNWTKLDNAYNAVFHFGCIKASVPLGVHIHVTSIPRPDTNTQSVDAKILLPGIKVKGWHPKITWELEPTSQGTTVKIAFNPCFPDASYHYVCLSENLLCHFSSDLEAPNNTVEFHNVPTNKTYKIWLRPRNAEKGFMTEYIFSTKGFFIPSDPPPVTAMSIVTERHYPKGDDSTLKLSALIVIPIILIAVISVTVFFFFNKGHQVQLCSFCKKTCKQRNGPPNDEGLNNMSDTENLLKTSVVVAFIPENPYFNKCVKSLTRFINKVHNVEAHTMEINSKTQIGQIDSNRVFLVVSEAFFQRRYLDHPLISNDGLNHVGYPDHPLVSNNGLDHVTGLVSFLPLMNVDLTEIRQPLFVISESFRYGEEIGCRYRQDDIHQLVESILSGDESSPDSNSLSTNYENHESQELLSNICDLYRTILTASKLPIIPYSAHIAPSSSPPNGCQHHYIDFKDKMFVENIGNIPHQTWEHMNGSTFISNGYPSMLPSNEVAMTNGLVHLDGMNVCVEQKLQRMPYEQSLKYTDEDYMDDENHDSGLSSFPTELKNGLSSIPKERQPFLPDLDADFFPPESEMGSMEMIEQRIQELNQRNSSRW